METVKSNGAGAGWPKGQKRQAGRPSTLSAKRKAKKAKPVQDGSHDHVLMFDIEAMLAAQRLSDSVSDREASPKAETAVDTTGPDSTIPQTNLPERWSEIEVEINDLSSTGDGLALSADAKHVFVVPFAVPGDVVKAKVVHHFPDRNYTLTDFISVVKPSSLRDDSRVKCQYFANCSGCQFQMLDYGKQLEHKKRIVEKAYTNFSQLPPELVPKVLDTIASPLQYGYRTKLTPHFDGPPGCMSRAIKKKGIQPKFESVPNIGFMPKGKRDTIDIEDCPIGTEAVRLGLKAERARVARELDTYKRGATILLRESTQRLRKDEVPSSSELPENTVRVDEDEYVDMKTVITNQTATSTEYFDSFVFTNPAGAFFQNNNSILPTFTQYIRDHILPPNKDDSSSSPGIKYLIDAYCGSGLFTITLSSLFESSIGIDIAEGSIKYASKNAALNKIPESQATFIAADAPELFKSVDFPKDETVVVIDPPRKGCDDSFLRQLLQFAPKRVVYVSCNVHTQARDVGVLVSGRNGVCYEIESLRGFDFFPQTGHVEGVAVLSRVDNARTDSIQAPSEV